MTGVGSIDKGYFIAISEKCGYQRRLRALKKLINDAGLHRQGSCGAVSHYTMLELADRFKLMNLAFDQEEYRVDKNLNVISQKWN